MIRLKCGDSLEFTDTLTDNSIDLIFTSPPYSDVKSYPGFKGIAPDKYVDWLLPFLSSFKRVIRQNGSIILVLNDRVVDGFRHPYVFELVYRAVKELDLKLYERLFWNKGKFLPNPKRFGDRVEFILWFSKDKPKVNMDAMRVSYDQKSLKRMKRPIKDRWARTEENQNDTSYREWTENPLGALPGTLVSIGSESQRKSDNHMAVFPMQLARYFIGGASDEGDTVYDPFMGIGTTILVAKEMNRDAIGADISADYVQQVREKLDN